MNNAALALVPDFDETSTQAGKRSVGVPTRLMADWIPVPLCPTETINTKCAAVAICSMLNGAKRATGF